MTHSKSFLHLSLLDLGFAKGVRTGLKLWLSRDALGLESRLQAVSARCRLKAGLQTGVSEQAFGQPAPVRVQLVADLAAGLLR